MAFGEEVSFLSLSSSGLGSITSKVEDPDEEEEEEDLREEKLDALCLV